MNTTKLFAIATLTFFGWTATFAADTPAWMAEDFIMEELVVTAKLPESFYMEEIVVTATQADVEAAIAALQPVAEPMEEVVATATPERVRLAQMRRALRARGFF